MRDKWEGRECSAGPDNGNGLLYLAENSVPTPRFRLGSFAAKDLLDKKMTESAKKTFTNVKGWINLRGGQKNPP
jgi:hypothetical protein